MSSQRLITRLARLALIIVVLIGMMLTLPVFQSAQAAGLDNALDFDGTDDYVDVPDIPNPAGSFTVEAWARLDTAGNRVVVSKISTGYYGYTIAYDGGANAVVAAMGTGSSWADVVGPDLTLGRWYHFALVYSSGTPGTMSFYVDGVLQGTTSVTPEYTMDSFKIGNDAWNEVWDGRIDEVRYWNTARTPVEIRANMYRKLTGAESGLVAYYLFNQGTAYDNNAGVTTLVDTAGTAENGTLSNFALYGSSSNWVSGVTNGFGGSALNFDGSDDKVDVLDANDLDLVSNYTLEAWIYPRTLTDYGGIISKYHEVDSRGYTLRVMADGSVDFDGMVSPSSIISTTQWYHLAAINTGGTRSLYVNGVPITLTGTPISVVANSDPLKIGVDFDYDSFGRFFDGQIDEARIWNTALTSDEISDSMYRELMGTEVGLVAYYKLNESEAAGIAYDTIAGVHNGTLNNFALPSAWRTSGAFSGPRHALDFDGTDDRVDIPDAAGLDLISNYTLEAWIYPHTLGFLEGIITKYHSPLADGYTLRVDMDGSVNFDEMVSPSGIISTNQWYHLAAVNANGTRRLYVNGVPVPLTGTPLTIVANTDPLKIGVDYDYASFGRFFDGLIDEARVWNTARTTSQIQDNMLRTLDGDEPELVAYYRFDYGRAADDNTGLTTLYDITGNSYDGTLTNFALTGTTSNWVTSNAFNTWIGGDTNAWTTASNWSRSSVPTSSDNVGVCAWLGGNSPSISSAAHVNHLGIAAGATLSVDGSNTLTVAGNWINQGSFTPNSSMVTLDGGNQALFGSTTFYSLTKITAAANTLTFQENTTQTTLGGLTLQGVLGERLALRSNVPGMPWQIDPQGARNVAYVDVQDSHNFNPAPIEPGTGSVSSGNNVGWNFVRTLTVGYAGSGNGSVASIPTGPTYAEGTVVTLTATPLISSTFTGWSGDVVTTANPIALTMDADKSVTATFTLRTYTITPMAGANGSIMPNTPQIVASGDSLSFTITPNTGYHILDVGVDGISQGAIGAYTFNNVLADHTITATFAINTYTLTPSAGPNGSITPSEPQTVSYGDNFTFAITADTGYHIADVRVDGSSVGAVSLYTFTNVIANHTITAAFAIDTFALTVNSTGSSLGSVSADPPGFAYDPGTVVTLTATPSISSTFAGWSGDIVTTANPTFITMDADKSVTATFTLKTYVITPTAGANGSITPSAPQTVNHGDSLAFTITPDTGYYIVDVGVDGVSQGAIGAYTFDNIAADHTITATFATGGYVLNTTAAGTGGGVINRSPNLSSYAPGAVVTLTATPLISSTFTDWSGDVVTTANPTVITMDTDKSVTATFMLKTYVITPTAGANGSITPSTPQTVNYGGSVTINIVPDANYHVADVLVDGVSQGPISTYTFSNVTADHTIAASFAINTYTLTPSAGANGSISPSTPQIVPYGGSATFNITANIGYHIADVLVDGVSQGPISTYTFSNVTADHTIAVSFAINTYILTPSAGANGSITPSTPQTVNHGSSRTFNFTPNTGYHIADVLVDGVSQGPIGSYTFSNVTADHTIAVSFAINTYTLTPSAGANGSISPSTPQIVNYGGSVTFNFTPNTGYRVANVLVDGVAQGAINSYTFSNVTANHTIAVSFVLKTYTLSPSAGSNGSISPYTPQTVNHGSSKTFTITANTGYHIGDVRVDGVSQGPISTYTFSNVTANHTITASFIINTYTLSPSAGPNGSITPSTPQTVNHGGSKTFTIAAKANYRIADVRVDGISQGTPGSYTFSNVTANHTITAAFSVAGPQTRTVGIVSITANTFTDLGGGLTRATGNLRLGKYLYLTGASDSVLFTSTMITATGKLTIRSGSDQVDVLNGTFRAPSSSGSGTLVGTPTYLLSKLADWSGTSFSVSTINIPAGEVNGTANLSVKVFDIDTAPSVNFKIAGSTTGLVYSGSLGAFNFNLGGVTIAVGSGATVSNAGISISSATLTLPSILGGASGTVNGLSLTKSGISVNGGTITLPEIKYGDGSKLKITNATASLTLVNGKYSFTVGGKLNVNLPGNSVKADLSFKIQNGQMSGTLSALNLTVAGSTLALKNLQISNDGLAVGQAALTLPAGLGGATTTLTNVSINSSGLSIGSGSIQLADIKIGDGSKVKIVSPKATLSSNAGGYLFTVNGTLQLRLPQNSQDVPVNGSVDSAGQFSATIGQLTLKLAGASLRLSNVTLNNSGLSVASGTLVLPAKLGGVSGSVNNVVINANGLSVAGGAATFPIPNFTVGGFSVSNAQAGLVVTNGGQSYRLNLNGTLSIAVRGNSTSATGSISLDDAGNISGNVSAFNLSLAGLTLNANNITIQNDGALAVGSASLKLPSGFGGASAAVYNVTIGSGEVRLGGGAFTLPEIKAGGFQLKDLGASLIPVSGGYEINAKGFATFPAVSGGGGCKGVGVSVTLFVNALGQTELALGPDQTNVLGFKNASFN